VAWPPFPPPEPDTPPSCPVFAACNAASTSSAAAVNICRACASACLPAATVTRPDTASTTPDSTCSKSSSAADRPCALPPLAFLPARAVPPHLLQVVLVLVRALPGLRLAAAPRLRDLPVGQLASVDQLTGVAAPVRSTPRCDTEPLQHEVVRRVGDRTLRRAGPGALARPLLMAGGLRPGRLSRTPCPGSRR